MDKPEQLFIYRGCTPVVDAEYGVESEQSPIEAIVEALAEAVEWSDASETSNSIIGSL